MPNSVPGWFGFERSWLARLLSVIEKHPSVFNRKEVEMSEQLLGLGNQQVYALAYWANTLKLCATKEGMSALTPRGFLIRNFDAYFEEKITWLAIHYWLSMDYKGAFSYCIATNLMPNRFSRDDLIKKLNELYPGKSASTYFNHSRVFYAVSKNSPISSLLKIFTIDDNYVSFNEPDIDDSFYPILCYAVVNWASSMKRKTIAIEETLQPYGPAKQFALGHRSIIEVLQKIHDRYLKKVLWVSQTAGLNSVGFSDTYLEHPLSLLRAAYLERLEGLLPLEALKEGLAAEHRGDH